ncbi:hypothetical protein [Tannerella forsythia]|uniref:hypothetical protein n=1 Tax=Tannerella forsythia TaxID=28112 RepID=UPI0028F157E4|nr:hypothetical protein [Tannerella forsythia]
MPGTRNPNAEGHPPPSKGGKSAAKRWKNRRTPSAFVLSASGGEPTEQRAGRKKIRLSEAKRVT